MSKIRVAGFAVSLDGFSAGVEQSLSDPLGKRGTETFQWFFHTRTFCSMHGHEGGSAGDIDDEFAHRAMDNFGAFILGRNMFSPVRGPWRDDSWKGWWAGFSRTLVRRDTVWKRRCWRKGRWSCSDLSDHRSHKANQNA
jgi:dihydrofolate reductase